MNPYQFAGERVDPATNLVHLRARWYDPAVGRFGSRDPFGGALNDPISLHRYLYANANPVSFTDPAGRLTLVNLTAANFIRATLIGVAFDLSVRSAFFDERITSATIIQSIVLNAIFAGPLLKAGSLAFSASIGGFRFAGITFVNETIVAFNRILMRQGGKALNVVLIRIYYYLPGGPALLRYVRGNIGVANAVFGELSPAAFTELRSRLAVFLSVVAP